MAIGDKKPVVMESDRAVPGGVATLGEDGILSEGQRPDAEGVGAIPATEKGKAGGVATLGEDGKLNAAQRPDYSISQVSGLQNALDGKQYTLAFDAEPTEGSDNPVKSGGVYNALSKKQPVLTGTPGQLIGIGDDGAAKATVYPSNPNLLDNWYFVNPVNRLGFDNYSAAGVAIDRWNIMDNKGSISLTDRGLTISANGTGSFRFAQYLSEELFACLRGKQVTLSVLTDDNKIGSITIVIPEESDMIDSANGQIPDTVFTFDFIYKKDSAKPHMRIYNSGGAQGEITIVAAKLEVGTNQTLAHLESGKWVLNKIPNYAEQYAICSQYSIISGEFIGSQYSNPNLLDNWYFADPINQRGKNEYTGDGTAAYTIDRWSAVFGSKDRIALTEKGVEIISVSGTIYFLQKMILDGLFGKSAEKLTFSILTDTGELYAARLGNPSITPFGRIYIQSLSQDMIQTVIQADKDNSITVVAAKLELGATQTLAHKEGNTWVLNDPLPNKALELAKCQRYYQIFPSIATIPGGVAPTADAPIKKEAFRPVMHSDITMSKFGTLDISGSIFYYADANL